MEEDHSRPWSPLWHQISSHSGWVEDVESSSKLRSCFENCSGVPFVVEKKNAGFGRACLSSLVKKPFRVRYQDLNALVPDEGVPFIVLSQFTLGCTFGLDKHKTEKERLQSKRNAALKGDHPCPTKHRRIVQTTRKKGCPARIQMKEVFMFPDFKLDANTKRKQKTAAAALRDAIRRGEDLQYIRRIYIRLPSAADHANTHELGTLAGLVNPLNKSVADKIADLVSDGVTDINEMRRHLSSFYKELFEVEERAPSLNDAAFYPSDRTIRNHIYMAKMRNRYALLDQENLREKVDEWKNQNPEDNFELQMASEPPSDTVMKDSDSLDADVVDPNPTFSSAKTFFFCHQTKFQRHLLERYGQDICLLDATYRTTSYALPLFFLVTKTNEGFSVVGEFVVQNESTSEIVRGLSTISRWMQQSGKQWKPAIFMTDYSDREINAIQEVFPSTEVILCDFHREQAWTRWTRRTVNGVQDQEGLLAMMRRCAHAQSEETFQEALDFLKASEEWKQNQHLQNWFSRTWLAEKKRWVWAYRLGAPVNTNNGVEAHNRLFKHKFLQQRRNNSLSSMMSSLIQEYVPSMMRKYLKNNVAMLERYGRQYHQDVPQYLRDRPGQFIRHCVQKMELGSHIPVQDIVRVDTSTFEVKSETDGQTSYRLSLSEPCCACHVWRWHQLPCKHMFACMTHFSDVTWGHLPIKYTASPLYTADEAALQFNEASARSCDDTTGGEDGIENNSLSGSPVPSVPSEMSESQVPSDLPSRRHGPQSQIKQAAIHCRELLSNIKDMTYLATDAAVLTGAAVKLKEVYDSLHDHAKGDDFVPHIPQTKKRQKVRVCRQMKRRPHGLPTFARKQTRVRGDKLPAFARGVPDLSSHNSTELPNGCKTRKRPHSTSRSSSKRCRSSYNKLPNGCKTQKRPHSTSRSSSKRCHSSDNVSGVNSKNNAQKNGPLNASNSSKKCLLSCNDDDHGEKLRELTANLDTSLLESVKVMIQKLEGFPDKYSVKDFLPAGNANPSLSLEQSLSQCYGCCLESVQTHLMETCTWGTESIKNRVNWNQMLGQILLFAHIQGISIDHAALTLQSVPGRMYTISSQFPERRQTRSALVVHNTTLSADDLKSVEGNNKLYDQVIHAYLSILKAESPTDVYIFPAFLPVILGNSEISTITNVQEWLYTSETLTSYRWLLMPVWKSDHWLLVVGDVRTRQMAVLDSTPNASRREWCQGFWTTYMQKREAVCPEGLGSWEYIDIRANAQTNPTACGVHVLMNADAIVTGRPPVVMRPCHVPAYRTYILGRLIKESVTAPKDKFCALPFCGKPAGAVTWVQCDSCNLWFHAKCLAVMGELPDKFMCPFCLCRKSA